MRRSDASVSCLAEHHAQAEQVLVPAFVMTRHFAKLGYTCMRHGEQRAATDFHQFPCHRRDHPLQPLMGECVDQFARWIAFHNVAPHQFAIFFFEIVAEILKRHARFQIAIRFMKLACQQVLFGQMSPDDFGRRLKVNRFDHHCITHRLPPPLALGYRVFRPRTDRKSPTSPIRSAALQAAACVIARGHAHGFG